MIVTRHYQESFRHAVEGRGAQFVLSMVPTRHEVYATALARIADDLGIRFFDVSEAFRDEQDGSGTVTGFPTDGHWNEEGHALMAELLAAER